MCLHFPYHGVPSWNSFGHFWPVFGPFLGLDWSVYFLKASVVSIGTLFALRVGTAANWPPQFNRGAYIAGNPNALGVSISGPGCGAP